jgi:uncharacterized protein YkwD
MTAGLPELVNVCFRPLGFPGSKGPAYCPNHILVLERERVQDKRNNDRCIPWFRLVVLLLTVLAPLVPSFKNPTRAFAQTPQKPSTNIYIPSVILGSPRTSVDTAPAQLTADWLLYVNSYRAISNLPPVSENPAWSSGGQAHAVYTVKNDILMHGEDPSNPWYTADGQAAAQSSNIMASYDPNGTDRYAIDSWMQAPFHAVGVLDPSLQQVGYGSYREADGGLQMAAALDVLRGMGQISASTAFPILFPGNGTVVPIGAFWGETPNPLTSCPGYTSPSGLPVILQLGVGNLAPSVEAFSFSHAGTALESCIFTESTYTNPDQAYQDLGRSILNERDAVVLIPRLPLTSGETYSVSMTLNGQTFAWSFTVAGTAQQFLVNQLTTADAVAH